MNTPDDEIIWQLKSGLSNEDIALRCGASAKRVARLRREAGLPATPKRGRLALTPQQDARAHQLRGQGLSWPVIGLRLGVGEDAARAAAKRHAERTAHCSC